MIRQLSYFIGVLGDYSPDQKAGPWGGLHFVTQNAYLARNLWECKGGKGFGAGEDLQQAGKTGKEKDACRHNNVGKYFIKGRFEQEVQKAWEWMCWK